MPEQSRLDSLQRYSQLGPRHRAVEGGVGHLRPWGLGFPCPSPLPTLVPRKGSVVSFILNLKALRDQSSRGGGGERAGGGLSGSKIRIEAEMLRL